MSGDRVYVRIKDPKVVLSKLASQEGLGLPPGDTRRMGERLDLLVWTGGRARPLDVSVIVSSSSSEGVFVRTVHERDLAELKEFALGRPSAEGEAMREESGRTMTPPAFAIPKTAAEAEPTELVDSFVEDKRELHNILSRLLNSEVVEIPIRDRVDGGPGSRVMLEVSIPGQKRCIAFQVLVRGIMSNNEDRGVRGVLYDQADFKTIAAFIDAQA